MRLGISFKGWVSLKRATVVRCMDSLKEVVAVDNPLPRKQCDIERIGRTVATYEPYEAVLLSAW